MLPSPFVVDFNVSKASFNASGRYCVQHRLAITAYTMVKIATIAIIIYICLSDVSSQQCDHNTAVTINPIVFPIQNNAIPAYILINPITHDTNTIIDTSILLTETSFKL